LEAIVPHLAGTSLDARDLVGTIYLASTEDEYSTMRDARDFALLLNGAGRTSKAGTGVTMCLTSNSTPRHEAEQILRDYRTELIRSVQAMVVNAERVLDRPAYTLFTGDGFIRERMTGAVCDVLASMNRARARAVLVRTTTQQGEVELSCRLAKESPEFDVGEKMQELAKLTSGVGGGTSKRGTVRFSMSKAQEFQEAVDDLFQAQTYS
jgi:hypothetical protein